MRSPYLWVVLAIAIAHLLLVALWQDCLVPSNVLQTLAVLLALGLSAHKAARTSDPASRRAWGSLVLAFFLFSLAQGLYLRMAMQSGTAPSFPSPADILWLLFPFPLLLLATASTSQEDAVGGNWLDTLQAALFFLLLAILVFSTPRVISVSLAYDLQSVALMLACLMRYRSSPPGPVRTVLRSVSIYLVVYACCSSLGNRLHESSIKSHAWPDLCWSYPPLIFCVAVLFTSDQPDAGSFDPVPAKEASRFVPVHLRAASAVILAIMSGISAAYVGASHAALGVAGVIAALVIFAARTGIREGQLHRAHAQLEHAAHHDALTGLANRTTLLERLRKLQQRPGSRDRQTAILLLDLDRFKAINESLGHPFGDRLLVRVSEMLREQTREEDVVVRLGGDEFVILLCSTTAEKANGLAERIIQLFQSPLRLEGRTLHITASVGIVLGSPGQSADELIRDADCALYEAKKAGRNRVLTFCSSMQQKATEALEIEMDLRAAIGNQELLVYYQPIVSVANGIVGFEALSRWNHARMGFVSPARFIPIAEETGLILELGRQVLEVATSQIYAWNQAWGRQLYASINVSAQQFANPEFLAELFDILSKTGLAPELLKLEITESVLLDGYNSVTATLDRARRHGIKISMDDFGTGYSSLSYLQRLPFDSIKIDQSFIRALGKEPVSAELVRTIVHLVQQLGKEVVAEGVETTEERDLLHAMRCDSLQGFLFSKPVPAAQVVDLLAKEKGNMMHPSPNTHSGTEILPMASHTSALLVNFR